MPLYPPTTKWPPNEFIIQDQVKTKEDAPHTDKALPMPPPTITENGHFSVYVLDQPRQYTENTEEWPTLFSSIHFGNFLLARFGPEMGGDPCTNLTLGTIIYSEYTMGTPECFAESDLAQAIRQVGEPQPQMYQSFLPVDDREYIDAYLETMTTDDTPSVWVYNRLIEIRNALPEVPKDRNKHALNITRSYHGAYAFVPTSTIMNYPDLPLCLYKVRNNLGSEGIFHTNCNDEWSPPIETIMEMVSKGRDWQKNKP